VEDAGGADACMTGGVGTVGVGVGVARYALDDEPSTPLVRLRPFRFRAVHNASGLCQNPLWIGASAVSHQIDAKYLRQRVAAIQGPEYIYCYYSRFLFIYFNHLL
jgi:hypothetical protein